MMTHRLVATLLACLALDAFVATVAEAQSQPAYNRGSTKVRSRLVNPFNVSSGLSVDRLGIVRYEPQARGVLAPAALASAATVGALAPAAAAGAAAATETVSLPSGGNDTPEAAGDLLGGGSNVRPPFRPPVRSPFRPPPRPPF
jgi:hypothetical protein